MEHQSEDILTSKKSKVAENGLVSLIETVELLRRNKIETNQSYSEAFFSTVKNYLG